MRGYARIIATGIILLFIVYILITWSPSSGKGENSRIRKGKTDDMQNTKPDKKIMTEEKAANKKDFALERAAFVILIRNSELIPWRKTMRQLEDRFNHQFHYPYVFLNDVPFTEEFKEGVLQIASGNVEFGLIPKEHWGYPKWIDQRKASEAREKMSEVIYGSSESYRHMCR